MGYRVMVKVNGSSQYQALAQDDEGFYIAPSNKLYHSYFDHETATRLVNKLIADGIDCKIVKG